MIQGFSELSGAGRYHLMTQLIIPRPIAWVLTRSPAGTLNLAPFSYFNAVSSEPALIMISCGRRSDAARNLKDTARSIRETGQCVVHLASHEQMNLVEATAADLAPDQSEVETFGVSVTEVTVPGFTLPRVTEAPVALFCKRHDEHELSPSGQLIIYLQIEAAFVRDEICRKDGKGRLVVDAELFNPLARLGAGLYSNLGKPSRPASKT